MDKYRTKTIKAALWSFAFLCFQETGYIPCEHVSFVYSLCLSLYHLCMLDFIYLCNGLYFPDPDEWLELWFYGKHALRSRVNSGHVGVGAVGVNTMFEQSSDHGVTTLAVRLHCQREWEKEREKGAESTIDVGHAGCMDLKGTERQACVTGAEWPHM